MARTELKAQVAAGNSTSDSIDEKPGRTDFLESLLKLDVPESAFDCGKRLVVAVLKRARHKWQGFVEHVTPSKSNCRVIQPSAPATGIVFGGGDGHDVFLLAVPHLHILTPILAIAGPFP